MKFAQRGLDRRLAGVAAPARQRPLTAMGAQARRAPRQQQRRCRWRHRSASTSAIATAARFSAGAGSLAGRRANAAQRAAIFRRVASSNGRIIPLDYNTPAIDEMTGSSQNITASRRRKDLT